MKRIRSKARGQRLAQLIELLQNTMPWEMLEMLGIRKANHAEQQKMEN